MKVAAQRDLRRVPDQFLQVGDESLHIFAIVVIPVVGVGTCDHVRDAVRRGRPAHGDADVPGFRSVVYLRKNVRMNIDHELREHRHARGVALSMI